MRVSETETLDKVRKVLDNFFEWYDDDEADLIEATQEAPSYLSKIRDIVG